MTLSTTLESVRQAVAETIWPEGRERRMVAERLANTDILTDLPNRRALMRALPTAEADPLVSVVVFDADDFGLVNKEFGHKVGDSVLEGTAAVIRVVARRSGMGNRVFRLGGDEFVALVPTRIAFRFRNEVEQAFTRELSALMANTGLHSVGLTGSVGQTLEEADGGLQARKRFRKGGRR